MGSYSSIDRIIPPLQIEDDRFNLTTVMVAAPSRLCELLLNVNENRVSS